MEGEDILSRAPYLFNVTLCPPIAEGRLTDRRPSAAQLVNAELEAVERLLEESAVSEIEVLQAGALHVLGAGGKRIRPQLVLLSALAAGGDPRRAVPLAAACELVHTATLVHDDIVDESDRRRGRTAIQFSLGNSASVLMGDYLVVRSFGLLTEQEDRRFWRILVETIGRMCEGEVLQICVKRDTALSLDVYEAIIEAKTALLMQTCTTFGALTARLPPSEQEALGRFGYSVGMAFQIQDDILDFIGDEEYLGKPTGGDLREGKVTLPVVFALRHGSADVRADLLAAYERNGPLSRSDIERTAALIDRAGGFDRAREHARAHIQAARTELARLPPSPAREALFSIAGQIVERWS